jgi:hypothetical protein
MKTIILHPEQNNLQTLKINVREKDYKKLKKLQYSGGFKRYGLSIYAENIKGQYKDSEKLSEYLNKVFIKPINSNQ